MGLSGIYVYATHIIYDMTHNSDTRYAIRIWYQHLAHLHARFVLYILYILQATHQALLRSAANTASPPSSCFCFCSCVLGLACLASLQSDARSLSGDAHFEYAEVAVHFSLPILCVAGVHALYMQPTPTTDLRHEDQQPRRHVVPCPVEHPVRTCKIKRGKSKSKTWVIIIVIVIVIVICCYSPTSQLWVQLLCKFWHFQERSSSQVPVLFAVVARQIEVESQEPTSAWRDHLSSVLYS